MSGQLGTVAYPFVASQHGMQRVCTDQGNYVDGYCGQDRPHIDRVR